MHADRGEEVGIGIAEDRRHRAACRKAGHIHAGRVDSVLLDDRSGEVARQQKIPGLIALAATLSASLGLINLLPIPALDGGRLIFLLLEAVRFGRRIDPKKEAYVHLAGMALLLLLMIFITYQDIVEMIPKRT